MIGIYKIENLINHKKYIGQSVHIERRWVEHCLPSSTSEIAKAIKEFGKENFSFEVIEKCQPEELNEKEFYWITFYDCIVPNGYNVMEYNGDNGYTNYYHKDKETILAIINDIKNCPELSLKAIGKKYDTHVSNISRINQGHTHFQPDEKYPLREIASILPAIKNYCVDCGKEICTHATRCVSCENIHRKIPLEEMRVTREQLKELIRTLPFTTIAAQFQVSDNSIRKWCKKFNLPFKAREIKKYTDEEWKLI